MIEYVPNPFSSPNLAVYVCNTLKSEWYNRATFHAHVALQVADALQRTLVRASRRL